jgi:hypothetical protein
VFAYLQNINKVEAQSSTGEQKDDENIENMILMPPIFKMCPKSGCKKRLIEKRFFSKK